MESIAIALDVEPTQPPLVGGLASRQVMLIAFFSFIVIGLPVGMLNVAWVSMQSTFGISLDRLGILLTAAMIGRLSLSFTSGRLMARFGPFRFLLLGCGLEVIAMATYGLAPTWQFLLVGATLAGLGSGSIDAAMNTVVSAYFSERQLNWLHACFGIGLTVGPLVVTFIVSTLHQSWRWSYGVPVLMASILGLLILTSRQAWQWDVAELDDSGKKSLSNKENPAILESLRNPIAIAGITLFFVYGGLEASTGQLTNSLFTEGRAIDKAVAGLVISIYWSMFTLGRVAFGFVAGRFPAKTVLRGSFLASTLGAIIITLNLADIISFVGLGLMGFAMAPIFPYLIAATPGRVGLAHAANVIGFQIGIAGLGWAFLPGIAGLLAREFGLEIIGPFLILLAMGLLLVYEWSERVVARQLAMPD